MAEFIPLEIPAKDLNALPVMHPGRPVGRDDELKAIYTHLQQNQAVLVHGAAGMGKTTLAAALAVPYTQQDSGVIWLNIHHAPLAEYLVRIGRAYGLSDVTTNENPLTMVGAVASVLTQNKPFIVIDGTPDAAATAQFVDKCAGNLPLMILSDEALDGPWEQVALTPLSDAGAVMLFKQKSGIQGNEQDINIHGIAKLMKHNPFALSIAARAMAASKQSPDAYYKVLQQVVQAAAGDGTIAALTASYRALNSALQGLILMLGATFRGEASTHLLSMVSGVPAENIDKAMTVLSQLYFVEKFERYGAPYYRMHSSVYQFAQTWLKGSNRLEPLQAKVRDAVVAFVQAAQSGDTAARQRLATEMDNIVAAARWAGDQGDRDLPNVLFKALTEAGNFVSESGYVYELVQLRKAGSQHTEAFPAYDPPVPIIPDAPDDDDDEPEDQFDFEDDELDELDEDFEDDEEEAGGVTIEEPPIGIWDTGGMSTIPIEQLRTALNAAKQQKDMPRQVQILRAIGKVQITQGKENEAITTYNEILATLEAMGDKEDIVETLDMLSALMEKTGSSQAAVSYAQQGIKLAQELGNDEARMNILITLGDARQTLGEDPEAIEAYSQALTITLQRDDNQNRAIILYKLGHAHLDNDEPREAIEHWQQARNLFKEQNKRDYEGRVLGGLGAAHSELEHWSEAINLHKSALHIAREVGDREEEALQLSSLGQALVKANHLPEALLRYRQALHLAYDSRNKDDTVSAIVQLVRLMSRSKRLLPISRLLIDDAVELDASDRDVKALKMQLDNEMAIAEASGAQFAPVNGTARDYAANAYKLLDE